MPTKKSSEQSPATLCDVCGQPAKIYMPDYDQALNRDTGALESTEGPRSRRVRWWRRTGCTGRTQAELVGLRRAPGTWNRWAYARDGNDMPIDGALTWAARARAFYIAQEQQMMQEQEETWAERRQALRESEWQAGEALLERGKRTLQGGVS